MEPLHQPEVVYLQTLVYERNTFLSLFKLLLFAGADTGEFCHATKMTQPSHYLYVLGGGRSRK